MDNEFILERFDLVLEKVRRFLSARDALQEENRKLKGRMLELENLAIDRAKSDKNQELLLSDVVKSRDDSLLNMLQAIVKE